MSIEINKMMKKNKNGTQDQFYPETRVDAVVGLNDALEDAGKGVVTSVNGKIGAVKLVAADLGLSESGVPHASENSDGIITKEMYIELKKLIDAGPSGITIEKV